VNVEKWDAIASRFASGEQVPANGWEAWAEQASKEAVAIRAAIPESVEILLEVGCGVGRLTPYLALMFPVVVATDTSAACRAVTLSRCERRGTVLVLPPDEAEREDCDAALVWNLYDSDWPAADQAEHRHGMQARYPIVLEGNPERWMLVEKQRDTIRCRTFEA
jgi:SAM-dependent methyltransferase